MSKKSEIKLSDHFTLGRLLRFIAPSIAMVVFTSIYSVVDGFFVSNYAGSVQFAALNFIMPFIMILSTIGFMFGQGGTALVSMTLGKGDKEEADSLFSLITYFVIVLGIIFSIIGYFTMPAVAKAFGADGKMLPHCVIYGRVLMVGLVPFMLQNMFQSFFITAEKPKLGFIVILAAGISNIILDWLFVGVFKLGLPGAAMATDASEIVGGLAPLFYFFSRKNSSLIHLGKTHMEWGALGKAATNGSSEFMNNIASSFVGILYNKVLMSYLGEAGVSAYGVIMYVMFFFLSIFIGLAMGAAPIVGFDYGAENKKELHNILMLSLKIITVSGILMFVCAEIFAYGLSYIFVSYDKELLDLTVKAFRLYSFMFLICGFNVFSSSFFTALSNGGISALISFVRTFIAESISVLFLPKLIGANGIWLSATVAECIALVLTIVCLIKYRKRYGY